MVDAIGLNISCTDLLTKIVCDRFKKECMLHRCPDCPGKAALDDYLLELTQETYDADDEITFKQWVSTDRTTIVTQQATIEEFRNL